MDEDDIDVEDISNAGAASQQLLAEAGELSPSTGFGTRLVQDPLILDQGWSLDHCSDEQSKTAIRKMLEEENYYISGKARLAGPQQTEAETEMGKSGGKHKRGPSRKYSLEEIETVRIGIEIYGKRWTKIQAELLPHRTKQEIRSCAIKYLSVEVTPPGAGQSSQTGSWPLPLPDNPHKHKKAQLDNRLSPAKVRGRGRPRKRPLEITNIPKSPSASSAKLAESAEVVKIKSSGDTDSEGSVDVDIDGDSDEEGMSVSEIRSSDPVYDALLANTAEADDDKIQVSSPRLQSPEGADRGSQSAVTGLTADSGNETLVESTDTDIRISPCAYGHDLGRRKLESISQDTDEPSGNSSPPQILHNEGSMDESISDSPVRTEQQNCDNMNKLPLSSSPLTASTQDESVTTAAAAAAVVASSETDADVDTEDSDDQREDSHPNEYGIWNSAGEIVYLPNPEKPVRLQDKVITDQEKNIHSEFFDGRPGLKNEDRYLRIRNHILRVWDSLQPEYVNKMMARKELRNCGDVNCVGRIHSYLEQIGAINFGCDQVQYKRLVQPIKPTADKPVKTTPTSSVVSNLGSRKRRVRDDAGQWVGVKELEGRTLEHGVEAEKKSAAAKTARVRSRSSYVDPFKLIPCQPFTDAHPAPFAVEIESSALVIMDAHCHLAKTEVIGMLGGRYLREQGKVVISMAEPCDSLSTKMQCEMDPVSQTEASEKICNCGDRVIGWYHSHPKFAPNPSNRDIATQMKFQEWFAQGGCPFLGMIISSYDRHHPSLCSDVRCLVVNDDNAALGSGGVPYQFKYTVTHSRWREEDVLKSLQHLAQKYATFPCRVELQYYYTMKSSNNKVTCLDKMLTSIKSHIDQANSNTSLHVDLHVNSDLLVAKVKDIFMESIEGNNSQDSQDDQVKADDGLEQSQDQS